LVKNCCSSKNFTTFFEDELCRIFGYIGKPGIARSERSAASLFVNDRLVSNKSIAGIMETAFKDYLMRQKYPFYVLFIYLAPDQVDFNVHPSKKVVKFLDEQQFFTNLEIILVQQVKQHIKQDLISSNQKLAPNIKKSTDSSMDYWTPARSNHQKFSQTPSSSPKSPASSSSRISNSDRKSVLAVPKNPQQTLKAVKPKPDGIQTHFKTPKHSLRASTTNSLDRNIKSSHIQVSQLPPLNLLNNGIQGGNNYLIFQNDGELVIIDQHAAHERINFEKVQQMFEKDKISIQTLLVPIKLEVAPQEVDFVKESLPNIAKFGFALEFFGGTSFIIRTIPALLKQEKRSQTLITDMCLEIIHKGRENSFTTIQREIIQYMACHMSITAGDEIWSEERIRRLVHNLDQTANPHHCAHGRPTYIKISFQELDKWFHRTP